MGYFRHRKADFTLELAIGLGTAALRLARWIGRQTRRPPRPTAAAHPGAPYAGVTGSLSLRGRRRRG